MSRGFGQCWLGIGSLAQSCGVIALIRPRIKQPLFELSLELLGGANWLRLIWLS